MHGNTTGRVSYRGLDAGAGNLTADFVVGTTDQVEVEYTTSCCNSDVSLTLVDIFGNWATGCGTEFTMQNCSIVQVKEVGPSWIFFEWSRPCGVEDSLEVDYAFPEAPSGEDVVLLVKQSISSYHYISNPGCACRTRGRHSWTGLVF